MDPVVVDLVVIGGGIVGLATALKMVERFPALSCLVLEKESRLGTHQTSHNSGVIHSGVYYRPGSLKARTCVAGAAELVAFCQRYGLPHAVCGKVIVAATPEELPALEELYRRGQANGVPGIALIGPERLRELEPHARGLKALHVPSTGIVDYGRVAGQYADLIRVQGSRIHTGARVQRLRRQGMVWIAETTAGVFRARALINCAGLQVDRVARRAGSPMELTIAPFRGEYYALRPERSALVHGLIYPVPQPSLPFLGVHFTKRIDGRIEAGPNAILAWKREGYRRWDVNLADCLSLLGSRGFWRMARRYWRLGLAESYRSFSKRAFVRALQRLVPAMQPEDLMTGGSGVRAQALDPSGTLVDDFVLLPSREAIHVCNVPSPAATASLAIGAQIAELAARTFSCVRNERSVMRRPPAASGPAVSLSSRRSATHG